jgi:hypothetical protein
LVIVKHIFKIYLKTKTMDRNEHFYEALYQIWMRGGIPDALSFDKSEQDWYDGKEPDYTAEIEIKRQRKHKQDEDDEDEEAYKCG